MAFNVVKHTKECKKGQGKSRIMWCICERTNFVERFNPPLLSSNHQYMNIESLVIIKALDFEYNYKMAILERADKYTIHYLKSQFDDLVKEYQQLFVHETCGVSKFLQIQIRNMYRKTDTKETCGVCLLEIEAEKLKTGKCGHMFHEECIRNWVISKKAPSCPICCDEC